MRILLINWARIVDGAHVGGGVNGYCQGLAIELSRRGHAVSYLSSGVSYSRPLDASRPPVIHRLDDFRAGGTRSPTVRVFDAVDSPVVAPAIFQFNRPDLEAHSAPLEHAFGSFLDEWAFDIVHFHNIEGLSAGCIDVALRARSRPRVLMSLHNYHSVCPQVYMMQAIPGAQMRAPCRDFRNGHACVECERTHDPAMEVARRIGAPEPPSEPSRHGVRVPQAVPVDLTLDNQIVPEPRCDLPPNAYADRRGAMVGAISRCHAVLAVSSFVRRKFEAMGVASKVLREMPIGTRMLEMAARARATGGAGAPLPFRDAPARSIRLAFLGYHNFYKGLHVLVGALESLAPEVSRRIELHVHAKDVAPMEPRLIALGSRLADVKIANGYAYEQVPAILSDKDLLVVPSVWWDNGPQTVMEAIACQVPVLASDVGGIPDLVTDGVDSLLFRAGDVGGLAARLVEVVRDPTLVDRLRERLIASAPPLSSMESHAAEMDLLYADLLAARAVANREATTA